MAHYNFKKDLEDSQKAVDLILDHLIDSGHVAFELIGKKEQRYGDIAVLESNDKQTNIEVKFDIMAAKTENLCFEMTNGLKLTGMMATKADHVYYIVPRYGWYQVFIFEINRLRKYLLNPTNVTMKNGGDRKKFSLALVSIDQIFNDDIAESIFRINSV